MGFWNYCWYVVCLYKIVRLLDGWLDVWEVVRELLECLMLGLEILFVFDFVLLLIINV